ncbi:glycoside hydrolase family 108 protein [Xenorhabdus entomophaga]|uniref:glycoside hydrolase family 108 protein n=1 Tax=Xenorhabdus entomophaga TaxID=3136257 RepID=UPI0030F375E6
MTQNTYSVAFLHAIHYLLPVEGGYVNDPHDRGGETQYGISKRSYPQLDIRALTQADATAIYYRDFWQQAGCERVPAGISLVLFDSAVQHGVVSAIRLLQRAVAVRDDGILGSKTRDAIAAIAPDYLLHRLMNQRARYYAQIIARNPLQQRFLNGWFNRLDHLIQAALEVV